MRSVQVLGGSRTDNECVLPELLMASWCRRLTAAKCLKIVHVFHSMGGSGIRVWDLGSRVEG